ncbi:MAG: hypothetical protein R3195_19415 [Gemmatimonadota bacterium]|nr:hypothetical protein [Gemmatimonadota bacterium]
MSGDRSRFDVAIIGGGPAGGAAAGYLRPLKAEGDCSYGMSRLAGGPLRPDRRCGTVRRPDLLARGPHRAHQRKAGQSGDPGGRADGDVSRERFAELERIMKCGCEHWYEFTTLYYRLNVLFTLFVDDPRYRLDVLRLLQGDVYEEERPAVLEKMREIVSEVERNPNHHLHPLLGTLTAEGLRSA